MVSPGGTTGVAIMTSRKENACSAPPKKRNRPYDNRPKPGPGHTARRTRPDSAVRVVLPDDPPSLTLGAAAVLLRILLKAHERLAAIDPPQGGDVE
jgi:hypothetical protein